MTAPNLVKISVKWSAFTLRVRFSTRMDAPLADGLRLRRRGGEARRRGDAVASVAPAWFPLLSSRFWRRGDRDDDREEERDEERDADRERERGWRLVLVSVAIGMEGEFPCC